MRRFFLSAATIVGFLSAHCVQAQLVPNPAVSPAEVNQTEPRAKPPVGRMIGPAPRNPAPVAPEKHAPPPSPAMVKDGGRQNRSDRDQSVWHRGRRQTHSAGRGWPWGQVFPGAFPYSPYYGPYYAMPVFGYNLTLPTNGIPVRPAALPGNAIPQQNVIVDPLAPAEDAPVAPRDSNPEQQARAGRFIAYGDKQFAQQKYLGAIGRYKTAVQTAPDLPEGYLRQAFAHVALGNYASAAKAFKRGLLVQPDWRGTAFRLDELYTDALIAKTQHFEDLAKAVEDNPFDSDLLLVLGLELYFDGQPDRAAVFLTRVAQFGGEEERIKYFLQPPKPADAPAAPPMRPRNRKVVF